MSGETRIVAPTRPVLRWHGGKWKLAPWIIGHFPAHRIYVEPFGGAASVLLRKDPSFAEIYNDLDGAVVNLFRVLREPGAAARLVELLHLTPFARVEFDESYEDADDPLERARRLIIRSYMGFGSDSAHTSGNTGFRAQSPKSNRSPEKDWANYPCELVRAIERLSDIVVECRPAVAVMARHDGGGHAALCRSSLSAGDTFRQVSQGRRQVSRLSARAKRRRTRRPSRVPADAGGHGGALRLSLATVRRRAA